MDEREKFVVEFFIDAVEVLGEGYRCHDIKEKQLNQAYLVQIVNSPYYDYGMIPFVNQNGEYHCFLCVEKFVEKTIGLSMEELWHNLLYWKSRIYWRLAILEHDEYVVEKCVDFLMKDIEIPGG